MGVTTGTGTPSYLRGTAATRAKENDERFTYQDQRTGKAAKAVQAIKDLKAKLAGHTRQEYAEAQVASKALQATRLEAAKAASTERTAKRASILHSLQTSPGAAAKLTVSDLRCLGAGLAKLDVLVLERMSPTVLASMTLDQVSQMRGPQLAWLSQQTGLLSYRQLAALGDAAHADRMHELLASNAEGALAIAGNWLAAMTGTDGKDPAAIPQIAVQEMHTVQGSTLALLPASWFAHFSPLQILALSSQQLQHVQADQLTALASACTGVAVPCSQRFKTLAQLKSASADDLTTWPNKSFAALDATAAASLTLAMLAAIPAHAIPALRNELLAGLTAQQFSVLRPDQLRALSPDQVRVLTARHFSALSAEQLSSLSAEQLQASSTAQKFSSWCQEHRGGNAPAVTAQALQSLGFASLAVLTAKDLESMDPTLLASIAPAAFAYLPESLIPGLSPKVLQRLTPQQAASLPLDALARMAPPQLAALLKAHATSLPISTRELVTYLVKFHAACDWDAGTINGSALTEAPDFVRAHISAAMPVNLSGLTRNTVGWLPDWLLCGLSEQQLFSVTREQVQGLTEEQLALLSPSQIMSLTGMCASCAAQALDWANARPLTLPPNLKAFVSMRPVRGLGNAAFNDEAGDADQGTEDADEPSVSSGPPDASCVPPPGMAIDTPADGAESQGQSSALNTGRQDTATAAADGTRRPADSTAAGTIQLQEVESAARQAASRIGSEAQAAGDLGVTEDSVSDERTLPTDWCVAPGIEAAMAAKTMADQLLAQQRGGLQALQEGDSSAARGHASINTLLPAPGTLLQVGGNQRRAGPHAFAYGDGLGVARAATGMTLLPLNPPSPLAPLGILQHSALERPHSADARVSNSADERISSAVPIGYGLPEVSGRSLRSLGARLPMPSAPVDEWDSPDGPGHGLARAQLAKHGARLTCSLDLERSRSSLDEPGELRGGDGRQARVMLQHLEDAEELAGHTGDSPQGAQAVPQALLGPDVRARRGSLAHLTPTSPQQRSSRSFMPAQTNASLLPRLADAMPDRAAQSDLAARGPGAYIGALNAPPLDARARLPQPGERHADLGPGGNLMPVRGGGRVAKGAGLGSDRRTSDNPAPEVPFLRETARTMPQSERTVMSPVDAALAQANRRPMGRTLGGLGGEFVAAGPMASRSLAVANPSSGQVVQPNLGHSQTTRLPGHSSTHLQHLNHGATVPASPATSSAITQPMATVKNSTLKALHTDSLNSPPPSSLDSKSEILAFRPGRLHHSLDLSWQVQADCGAGEEMADQIQQMQLLTKEQGVAAHVAESMRSDLRTQMAAALLDDEALLGDIDDIDWEDEQAVARLVALADRIETQFGTAGLDLFE